MCLVEPSGSGDAPSFHSIDCYLVSPNGSLGKIAMWPAGLIPTGSQTRACDLLVTKRTGANDHTNYHRRLVVVLGISPSRAIRYVVVVTIIGLLQAHLGT